MKRTPIHAGFSQQATGPGLKQNHAHWGLMSDNSVPAEQIRPYRRLGSFLIPKPGTPPAA